MLGVDAWQSAISGRNPRQTGPCRLRPAEAAFLASLAVAQSQKTRSFELYAALPLAKLYRATGRDAVAHAVLEPALEGFTPTPKLA